MQSPVDFKAMRLKLASPDEILDWSHGEVKKPETINYRTQRPEKDGLFCEKIFGPIKDWECYCGKYKRIRYKGIVCDKCGVEVTRSIVRRERMAHIQLAAPVCHIWFLRGVPSKIGLILDLSVQNLEKIIYFAAYLIIDVDEKAKEEAFAEIEEEYKAKVKEVKSKYEKRAQDIKSGNIKKLAEEEKVSKKDVSNKDSALVKLYEVRDKEFGELKNALSTAKKELGDIKKLKVISEIDYRDLSLKYGHVFQASIGAEAVRKALEEIDLDKLSERLGKQVNESPLSQVKKMKRRLRLVRSLSKAEIRPEWMILTVLPVIPPDLRPMVQLDGGRFAASDLNDLYRRVINRNNRLKRLIELNAPDVICRNEKRMLQEAVDALIDNSARRGKAVAASTGQKRVLKSLADMLRGKQGRFRQNLLGKRVDYSGRSVIVIGPELKLNECGIPKKMALELFKPFVINKLIGKELAHNVRSASRLIEEGRSEIWDILEDVIKGHYVMLNRAPTLHRLGIQAFQPVLIEGKALRIHPMVCAAFNADFDGDQMAVHIPLTFMARKEAREIMAADKNLLKPATGDPITMPSKDMVLGCYYITNIKPGVKGEGKIFHSPEEAVTAYRNGFVDVRAKVKVRVNKEIIATCVGRLLFNEIIPDKYGFVNKVMDKKALKKIISRSLEMFGMEQTVQIIDDVKRLGFYYLTRSGVSWGMDDLQAPSEKKEILAKASAEVEDIRQQYKSGLLTGEERYAKIIETWAKAKDEVSDVSMKALDPYGSVYSMVESGARGSWQQVVQMTGMRGLMANPAGKTIELPVKNSFKEGLDVLEYFISTHGARKGLSDTALRTANAGYLTRRLIDVSQDIVIEEEDCKDTEGFPITKKDGKEMNESIADRALGRVVAEDVKNKTGKVIVKAGTLVDKDLAKKIEKLDPDMVRIRSIMSCKAKRGICAACYGWDLGFNKIVEQGQAVGIVAAQSIGEPGTQLTMRTFHTGGVAGESDITQGLPRVEELFEARGIKNPSIVSDIDGIAHVEEEKNEKTVRIVSKDFRQDDLGETKDLKLKVKSNDSVEEGKVLAIGPRGAKIKAKLKGMVKVQRGHLYLIGEGSFEKEYKIGPDAILWVQTGDLVTAGQQLTEGHVNLQHLFKVGGQEAIQRYILKEVQFIYSSQGQDVDDKHVEIIIKKMTGRTMVKDGGDTDHLEGEIVDRLKIAELNKKLKKEGKALVTVEDLLLGITKASLSTESFLSAASFQETARVLIDAAITGKTDDMTGLKENVIIGKLIPSGTGHPKFLKEHEKELQELDEHMETKEKLEPLREEIAPEGEKVA